MSLSMKPDVSASVERITMYAKIRSLQAHRSSIWGNSLSA